MNFIPFIQGSSDYRTMEQFEFVTGTRYDNVAAYERKYGSKYSAINRLSYDIDQMYDGYEDICIGDDGKLYTVLWLHIRSENNETVEQPGVWQEVTPNGDQIDIPFRYEREPGYLQLQVKPNKYGAHLGALYWRGERIANAAFSSFEHAAKVMNDERELSDWIERSFFG